MHVCDKLKERELAACICRRIVVSCAVPKCLIICWISLAGKKRQDLKPLLRTPPMLLGYVKVCIMVFHNHPFIIASSILDFTCCG